MTIVLVRTWMGRVVTGRVKGLQDRLAMFAMGAQSKMELREFENN